MLTGAQYRESLVDGRRVYHAGKLIDDVGAEPALALAVDEVAAGYDKFFSAEPGATNPMLAPPRSKEELRAQGPAIEELGHVLGTTYQSLNTLLVAAGRLRDAAPDFVPRIYAYVEDAVRRDIRISECITDAKGDRSKHPAAQPDPDSYVRVVERRPDGVVIRGAKLHITGAAVAHELLVMPTKTMKPGEEEQYSIACAVPVNSPNLHLTTTGYTPLGKDPRDYPVSGRRSTPDSMCIFDDVFVPDERVFLDGHAEHASVFAHSLGLWERLGGVSGLVSQADEMVGLAQLVAEANGLAKVPHVREKIDEMAIHATLLRAGLEAALANAHSTAEGYFYPDDMYTNVTKYLGATRFSDMVRHLHDIAGGAVVTAPSMADFDNTELGPMLRKYMSGAPEIGGEYRTQLFHAIRDTTADSYGGWWTVTNIQSGGGLFAQRLVTRKLYDMERAKARALELAGIAPR